MTLDIIFEFVLPLPSIDSICNISKDDLREFRDVLRRNNLNSEFLNSLRPQIRIFDELSCPVVEEKLRSKSGHLEALTRLLCFGDYIDPGLIKNALGDQIFEALLSAGIIKFEISGTLFSPFKLNFYRGNAILADFVYQGGDVVFSTGPGSKVFRNLSQCCTDYNLVLDLGCGAGSVVLSLAQSAKFVIGTDINPRAESFFRFNAEFNDIENVEFRLGDKFCPVENESFDLITSQPPFMPKPLSATSKLFRDGGRRGYELWTNILSNTPKYLVAGGVAVVVCEVPDCFSESSFKNRIESDLLAILGKPIASDVYAIRASMPELNIGYREFCKASREMYRHLQLEHIRSLCPAVIILHKSKNLGRTQVINLEEDVWGNLNVNRIIRDLKKAQ